jgi:hypothetical protein
MFLSFFGGWWLYLGVRGLAPPVGVWALLALCGGALFLAGLLRSRIPVGEDTPGAAAIEAQRRRAFQRINIVQWSAIVAMIVVLNVLHRVEWLMPAIMLIVGLHFFPLARLFGSRDHRVLGAALAALAVGYPLLCPRGPLDPLGPLLAGLILWTAALVWIVRRR